MEQLVMDIEVNNPNPASLSPSSTGQSTQPSPDGAWRRAKTKSQIKRNAKLEQDASRSAASGTIVAAGGQGKSLPAIRLDYSQKSSTPSTGPKTELAQALHVSDRHVFAFHFKAFTRPDGKKIPADTKEGFPLANDYLGRQTFNTDRNNPLTPDLIVTPVDGTLVVRPYSHPESTAPSLPHPHITLFILPPGDAVLGFSGKMFSNEWWNQQVCRNPKCRTTGEYFGRPGWRHPSNRGSRATEHFADCTCKEPKGCSNRPLGQLACLIVKGWPPKAGHSRQRAAGSKGSRSRQRNCDDRAVDAGSSADDLRDALLATFGASTGNLQPAFSLPSSTKFNFISTPSAILSPIDSPKSTVSQFPSLSFLDASANSNPFSDGLGLLDLTTPFVDYYQVEPSASLDSRVVLATPTFDALTAAPSSQYTSYPPTSLSSSYSFYRGSEHSPDTSTWSPDSSINSQFGSLPPSPCQYSPDSLVDEEMSYFTSLLVGKTFDSINEEYGGC